MIFAVSNLEVDYPKTGPALRGVSFSLAARQIGWVAGESRSGKSTLLRAIMGVLEGATVRGQITLDGQRIDAKSSVERARAGLGLVPEGRQVFGGLSVRENLLVGAHDVARHLVEERLARVYTRFAPLKARDGQRASTLSGGEAQMLSIARGIIREPKLLLLDEPTLGLAPSTASEILELLEKIRTEDGVTLLISTQRSGGHGVAEAMFTLTGGRLSVHPSKSAWSLPE